MTIKLDFNSAVLLRRALDDEGVRYVMIPPYSQLNDSYNYVFLLEGYVKLEVTKRCWSLYTNNKLIITLPIFKPVNCLCAW